MPAMRGMDVPVMRVPASQLRPGDILRPTNRTVATGPTSGLRTPAGKCELTLRRRDGSLQGACFNRRTLITIERPA
jgi:hypothetical protein